ncbi:ParA family protein [Acidianus manzaensis]|nr:ParA family protein [Acidianus manzaensis]
MRITILSAKGGIGKSTISLLLGKFFACNGKNTLIIDRDPLGWISRIAGITDNGLLSKIVNRDDNVTSSLTELHLKGKLGVLKLYGDGPRFYVDYENIKKKDELKNKLEMEYKKIITKNYNYFIVDNPSMVGYMDEEVFLELYMFRKILPQEKIFRIYITDSSDASIQTTKKYIESIEKDANNIGTYIAVIINLVPPFPEDIEKAKQKASQFEKFKIVLPFKEDLFMINKEISEINIPEEIKSLGEYISSLNK